MSIILEAKGLSKTYQISMGIGRGSIPLRAVHDISFALKEKQTLAIVGESGCGKSTLARLLTMIEAPTKGTLSIYGQIVTPQSIKSNPSLRHQVQIILQNPYSSLNPRQKIGDALIEVLTIQQPQLSKESKATKAREFLALVGLKPEHFNRYPHMFSGGQRQRIAIARALIGGPKILICDEPVSALDISIQAQILNLLKNLQKQLGLSLIFISHDLSVVEAIADDVMVMYLGQMVEYGNNNEIFTKTHHPYSQSLLAATPSVRPILGLGVKENSTLPQGEIPSALNPPSGCVFHPRCPNAKESCNREIPLLAEKNGHLSACVLN